MKVEEVSEKKEGEEKDGEKEKEAEEGKQVISLNFMKRKYEFLWADLQMIRNMVRFNLRKNIIF